MIDVYVSAESSKDVPCKGEILGNHIGGLESSYDILMITQAFHICDCAGMFLQTDKRAHLSQWTTLWI